MQESRLQSTKVLPTNSFPNYSAVRKERPGDMGGGGLITLIHHSITFIRIPSDSFFIDDSITEHLLITATINNILVNFHNIYITPISNYLSDFTQNFPLLFNFRDNNINMGDFKAHSPAWYSQTTCTLTEGRGTLMVQCTYTEHLMLEISDLIQGFIISQVINYMASTSIQYFFTIL